jgi:hypothetical protein
LLPDVQSLVHPCFAILLICFLSYETERIVFILSIASYGHMHYCMDVTPFVATDVQRTRSDF